ncbi:hypothetical protein AYL99_11436 [Fonsecaea erecta]|uniref:3-oxoacyl-[acyl-carrier protein] reductase n=1 Tax=Fonsecaea erecta TaxID=1367422 RepID=A0A178Z5I8_9EURO|nr:hypothetical protein AYL99_11436 [Fonsecaea erecta]OAP54335.1 hypothetical protein AYL99_11436 [Fonsecaea erecta]
MDAASSLSFQDRAIAITGGASGIGLAVAKTLLMLGATVYIADLAQDVPNDLKDCERVHFMGKCDVTKRTACKEFIDSIPGRVDGLVTCAGVAPFEGKLAPDEIFQLDMNVNVAGTWNVVTETIRRMTGQEQLVRAGTVPGTVRDVGQGSIVTFGSGAALRGVPGLAAYCASKHAVLGLTRTWAKDFPGLRVNMIAPGLTDTPMAQSTMTANTDASARDLAKNLVAGTPKGRLAYPTDIADAVIFLLSDWSSFITGQALPVNGGNF